MTKYLKSSTEWIGRVHISKNIIWREVETRDKTGKGNLWLLLHWQALQLKDKDKGPEVLIEN